MRAEAAEALALDVLGWMAGEKDLLALFMDATGTNAGDLRSRAGDAEFLAAVLEFVMSEDAWARRFTQARTLTPEALQAARAALPGGDQPHWT